MPTPKRVKKGSGFLDVPPDEWVGVPAWLMNAKSHVLKGVGQPCDAYNSGCASCKVWQAMEVLREFYS